jgi:hypothetical protein
VTAWALICWAGVLLVRALVTLARMSSVRLFDIHSQLTRYFLVDRREAKQ